MSTFAALSGAGSVRHASVQTLVILILAGAYALAWRSEVFLLVVGIPAGALATWVHERLAGIVDARRAAALAVTAPVGLSDADAVERIVVADLAALSLGNSDALDAAIVLAEHTIADPWRRSLTCERLEAAKRSINDSDIGPPRVARLVTNRLALIISGAALAGTLISIQVWRHEALLVPLTLSLAAVTVLLTATLRSGPLCELLVSEASTDPARGSVVVPDGAVVAAVAGLTHGRPGVHRRAVRLVATATGPERAVGARRMARSARPGRRLSQLDRDLLIGIAAAVVLVAALEAM